MLGSHLSLLKSHPRVLQHVQPLRVAPCRATSNKKRQQTKERKKDRGEHADGDGRSPTEQLLHKHFADVFGDRWPSLWRAMQQPTQHAAFVNPHANRGEAEDWQKVCSTLPVYIRRKQDSSWGSTRGLQVQASKEAATGALTTHYFLDLASVFPVLALAPLPGSNVLDMCAAPGGKSLLLSTLIFPPGSDASQTSSHLIANDRSPGRRSRLINTLRHYLPSEYLQHIDVTCRDAGRAFGNDLFDSILLDAPCSSERHLAQRCAPRIAAEVVNGPAGTDNDDDMPDLPAGSPATQLQREDWSPSRSSRNAQQQGMLFLSALRALKPGGRLVYSTCSISPIENDGVVSKAMKKLEKQGLAACVVSHDLEKEALRWQPLQAFVPEIEKTEHGWQILPDTSGGYGPMYWSTIMRV